MSTKPWFNVLAQKISHAAGRPGAFLGAVALIITWAVMGPVFQFSDTWQLVINTTTTIITFLMVFLIQSTQNRDSAALQIKLDELIRVTEGAHLALLDLEELDDKVLEAMRARYEKLAERARKEIEAGGVDTGVGVVD